MKPEQKRYLELLRSGLWEKPSPCGVDAQVYSIAVGQSTTALVCRDSEDEQCQEEVMRVMWSHGKLNAVIAALTDILSSKGIDCVLLKGQGCAANYLNPLYRNCGDIDLYVGKEKYDDAVTAISAHGGSFSECERHLQLRYKGVVVEIHRNCMDTYGEIRKRTFLSLEKEGLYGNLPTLDLDGCTVRVPEENFNAVYILYHMVHHLVYGGIGFRQLCDWTMFLHTHKDTVDRDRIYGILKRMHMLDTWQLFGYMAVNTLGLPEDEMPFYSAAPASRAQQVLELIFERGNFGRASEDDTQKKIAGRRTFIGRKSYAMALYVKDYYHKRALIPDLMPVWALFYMLGIGFGSTFSKIVDKRK